MTEIVVVHDPDDELVHEAADLATAYWREMLGEGEPSYPVAELAWELADGNGAARSWLVVALEGSPVGALLQRFPRTGATTSWCPWLYVTPTGRRRGVGRALMGAAVDLAHEHGWSQLSWPTADGSTGWDFSQSLGATVNDTVELNRLWTAHLDRTRLQSWAQDAGRRSPGYSLVNWDGPCPDELLESFAALQVVMDDAPGAIPDRAAPATVAAIRRDEGRWLRRGPSWRVAARHDTTGDLAGFTELQIPAARPAIANQGDTGVLPAHRRHGLGRWLKATNLFRLVNERPDVAAVDTTTATDNQPMNALNHQLGFRTTRRWTRWHLSL